MQRADNRNTSNRLRVQEWRVEWMPSSWKCTTVRRRHCQTDRMRCRWIDFSRYYSCCATFTSLFAGHSELHLWANFLTMKLLLLLTLILCLLGPAGAQTTS